MKGYSITVKGDVGKARLEGVDASYKDLVAVCDNIRYLPVEDAIELLEDVIAGKAAIYYRKHNKKMGHRRELGGKKGRYPKKAAKIVLKVLKAAIASAEQKNVKKNLAVLHAAANKKHIYPRLAPKGRRIRSDYVTARVEIVVVGEKVKEEKKVETKQEGQQTQVKQEKEVETPQQNVEVKAENVEQSSVEKQEEVKA
jgi:large subunit ribosomal protein L22